MQNSFPEGAARECELANFDSVSAAVAATSNPHATSGARVVTPADHDYPERLHELPDPPKFLWARGTLAIALPPAIAIVGTRNATPYGIRSSKAIAAACARAGVSIVSGLARGIDGAAHHAALEAGGRTVAVLGTGVDVFYPRRHRNLQERIARDGLLLSEHPSGSTGHAGAFPRRNRIIAALASMVIIIEAGESSGALITAARASELHRLVAVVPGPIDSPASIGSNSLFREGATPIFSPAHALELLSIDPSPPILPFLDGDAALCWDALRRGVSTLADIARVAGLSTRVVAAAISALELEGLVVVDTSGRIHSTVSRVDQ